MARISIYVPDPLKERMDAAEDRINWSEVARPAFEAKVAADEHQREPTMRTAIERLRTSKQKTIQDDLLSGQQDGRDWARDSSEYSELVRVSRIRFDGGDYRGAERALKAAVDPDDDFTTSVFYDHCFGSETAPVTDEYVAGFIEGAKQFFDEVKNEL
jgi:hypothetical protein